MSELQRAMDECIIEAFRETQMEMFPGIDGTLKERGTRYGDFGEHARITQNIKAAMVCSPNWKDLSPDMKESLEMIAHKIGRILNGDPNYKDSWTDIVGYARLVEQTL